jgi:hypothetical protein
MLFVTSKRLSKLYSLSPTGKTKTWLSAPGSNPAPFSSWWRSPGTQCLIGLSLVNGKRLMPLLEQSGECLQHRIKPLLVAIVVGAFARRED